MPNRKMETQDFERIAARISGIALVQQIMGDDFLKTCLYTTGVLQSDDLHTLYGDKLYTAASKAIIKAYARF